MSISLRELQERVKKVVGDRKGDACIDVFELFFKASEVYTAIFLYNLKDLGGRCEARWTNLSVARDSNCVLSSIAPHHPHWQIMSRQTGPYE